MRQSGREFYDDKETMSAEERKEYLERRLRDIVQYAYENAPAIKERFDSAGIDPREINEIKDLENLPIIKKEELHRLQAERPPFGGFVTTPVEKLDKILVSPGALLWPWLEEEYFDAQVRVLYNVGIRRSDTVLITFALNFPIAHALEYSFTKLAAIPVVSGPGNTSAQIETMRKLQVNTYLGGWSFLINIIERAEEQGYDFCRDFNLRKVISGGEVITPAQKQEIEEKYRFSIAEFYGTNEVGTIGYTCSENSGYHILGDMIVEIVDPETQKQLGPGKVGEAVVTYFSKTYPLIRLGLGDLFSYTDEPCACGCTSNRLGQLIGRIGDAVKVRAVLIYPYQVEKAVSFFPEVSNFQAEATRSQGRDEITLKVETKEGAVGEEKLASLIKEKFQQVSQVRLDRVEFVPEGTIPRDGKVIVDKKEFT